MFGHGFDCAPSLLRGHGSVQVVALRDLWELFTEGSIVVAKERAGSAATVVAAAGEIIEHGVVPQGVHEGGVALARALPLPEGREAVHVVTGVLPPPALHQLPHMRGIEAHQRIPLQSEKTPWYI